TNFLGSCDRSSSRRVVSLRVATSHSLTYLLPLPEASVLPSGGNARESTPWQQQTRAPFFSVAFSLLDATSQNRIVLSPPPETRVLPSGLKATHRPSPVCPRSVNRSLGSWADRGDEKSRHAKVMPSHTESLSTRLAFRGCAILHLNDVSG